MEASQCPYEDETGRFNLLGTIKYEIKHVVVVQCQPTALLRASGSALCG